MTAFDLPQFLQEQLGDDHRAIELGDGIQAMRDVARADLLLLLRRLADLAALITEEFIPLAHKVARRELSGHTFYALCAQLEAALESDEPAELLQAVTESALHPTPAGAAVLAQAVVEALLLPPHCDYCGQPYETALFVTLDPDGPAFCSERCYTTWYDASYGDDADEDLD